MHKIVTMPDRITFDMVKAAMKELGLAGGKFSVDMTTEEVTVTATVPGCFDQVTRTYGVNDWAVSYQSTEEKSDGPATARR